MNINVSEHYTSPIAALMKLFSAMHVEVPTPQTDLFDSGILDSQRMVELILQVEQRFGVKMNVEDFELEDFRSIDSIAALIDRRVAAGKATEPAVSVVLAQATRV